MTPPNSTKRLRLPGRLGALFFVSYLSFQAWSAISCFVVDYGCKLTWTMYAGRDENPLVTVMWRSGEETAYDEDEGVRGVGRILGSKVDWEPYLPPFLCANLPDAEYVRLEFQRPPREELVRCR